MKAAVIALALALGGAAHASQERTHSWKAVTIGVSSAEFGDISASAAGDGWVAALTVTVKGKTIVVPTEWIAKLPVSLKISTIDIRVSGPWVVIGFLTGRGDRYPQYGLVGIQVSTGKVMQLEIQTHDIHGMSSESLPGPKYPTAP